jgi:hypothetical protein
MLFTDKSKWLNTFPQFAPNDQIALPDAYTATDAKLYANHPIAVHDGKVLIATTLSSFTADEIAEFISANNDNIAVYANHKFTGDCVPYILRYMLLDGVPGIPYEEFCDKFEPDMTNDSATRLEYTSKAGFDAQLEESQLDLPYTPVIYLKNFGTSRAMHRCAYYNGFIYGYAD